MRNIIGVIVLLVILLFSESRSQCTYAPTTIGSYPEKTYQVSDYIEFSGALSHDLDNTNGNNDPKWSWSFNYHQSLGFHPDIDTADEIIEWRYTQPGTYIVAVQYTDDDGEAGNIDTMSIIIGSQVPRADVVYSYNHADQVDSMIFPSIITMSPNLVYTYDARGRLEYLSEDNNGSYYESLGYENNGNVDWQEFGSFDNSYINASFSYDGLNRLVVASGMGPDEGSRYEAYNYDNDGNITLKNQDYKGYSYSYDSGQNGNNRLTSITTLSAAMSQLYTQQFSTTYNLTYDYRGNMISNQRKGINNIKYNYQNLPVLMQTQNGGNFSYRYDDQGNRVYKKVSLGQVTTEEYYLRDQTGREVAVYDVPTQRVKMWNLYGNDLVGRVNINWKPTIFQDESGQPYADSLPSYDRYYYIKDHLGNIIETVAENGNIVNQQYYYPFGGVIPGTSSTNGGVDNERYKFTGKERDNETEFDYFGARFYDSDLGRWLCVDPLAEFRNGLTPYNYCQNNPLLRIDPDGRWDIKVYSTPNRGKTETGYAQLVDRNGKVLYSYETKNRGAGGRDRQATNGDTPTGTYKINGWEEKADRQAYGPNKVLRLTPESGEAKDAADAGRGGFLQHGGRQEGPNGDPNNLATTNGCTRVFDKDQENLIKITAELEKNDPEEKPGSYTVEDAIYYKPIIVTPQNDKGTQKKDEKK